MGIRHGLNMRADSVQVAAQTHLQPLYAHAANLTGSGLVAASGKGCMDKW